MRLRIRDLGVFTEKTGIKKGYIKNIGTTSILLEWIDNDYNVLYRILMDCGYNTEYDNKNLKEHDKYIRIPVTHHLLRIKGLIEDKVPGFDTGIQAFVVTHAHEDHIGGFPWVYEYYKEYIKERNKDIKDEDKKLSKNRIPKLYMSNLTWKLFHIVQEELYDLFVVKGSGFAWSKGIINEIKNNYCESIERDSPVLVEPLPKGFKIEIRLIPSGHILGSTMIEIDTKDDNDISLGKVLFTGDMCVRDGSFIVDGINYDKLTRYKAIIMEGTYFGKSDIKTNRKSLKDKLEEKIKTTIINGGNVIIIGYVIDRIANGLVALREIQDHWDNTNGPNLREKIKLDTSTGLETTNIYYNAFNDVFRYGNSTSDKYHFREELINEFSNSGINMFQLKKDKRLIFDPIRTKEHRKEIIEKGRNNGGFIIFTTSATLMGGVVLQEGSYMREWGGDKRNLFLILGGAIPGVMAKTVLDKSKKGDEVEIIYNDIKIEDGVEKIYPERFIFSGRIEALSEYSAHASFKELESFMKSIRLDENGHILITHIGDGIVGSADGLDYEVKIINPRCIVIDEDHKVEVELGLNKNVLYPSEITWKNLSDFCKNTHRIDISKTSDYLINRKIGEIYNEIKIEKTVHHDNSIT